MDTAAGRWVSYIVKHPANRRRRGRALGRSIAYQVRARLTGKPIIARLGGARVWVHLHEIGMSRAVYANPFDFPQMQSWKRLLSPGDLFVDVGANVGAYSVWAAARGAQIVAVEPNPHAVARLRANAELNGFRFEIHTLAVSNSPGRSTFSTDGDVLGRLSEDGDIEVETTTVDALLGGRHARGVKIDVEGYERLVLEGARQSLSAGLIDYLQLEWNEMSLTTLGEDRAPVAELLSSYGYTLATPDNDGRLRRATEKNLADTQDLFAVRPGLSHEGFH